MIELETRLSVLEKRINRAIDDLIPLRQTAKKEDIYKYRYVIKKLETALGAIHAAQNKIENNS